jgi:hypothetical protein
MRRLFRIAIPFSIATLSLAMVLHFSVYAHRSSKDLASSQKGSSNTAAENCSDDFPTPFAAVLNGQVTPTDPANTPPSCTNFTGAGAYPNYSISLRASDNSFTLTVTPVLWGNGNADSTILHLEFSSTTPNLSFQSFVIGGLNITGQQTTDLPSYVSCDFGQASTSLYLLPVIKDNLGGTFAACTQPTMEAPGSPAGELGFASAIQPTPIQFADTNTTRWDIVGLTGSTALPTPLPSVDLYVPGVPNDLINSLSITGAATNNLTSSFMGNQGNFLAVAFDSAKNKTVTAGGLSIVNATAALTNDSISSATTVDAMAAISVGGFLDQVNTVGATPQENSDGTFLNPPTGPPDPTLPATCLSGGGADSQIFRTVWYAFTPVADGTVTIDTAKSRYDSVLAIFSGQPGSLTLVACDDDVVDAGGVPHLQAMMGNIPVSHGTPYLIMVGESPTQTGVLNDSSTGNPTTQNVAAPLSNDATLFFSVVETPSPAAVSLNPVSGTSLTFGTQQVGVASQPQKISVASKGGTPLNISNITVPAGFTFTSTCGSPLPQGAQCEIDVTMNPTTVGPISGNLTFTDNVNGSSPSYPITGTGVDFTFPTPTVTVGTLTSTSNATYNLSVSGSANFGNSVTFACSGLPINTGCSFQPSSAMPGGGSIPVVLTVSRLSNTTAHRSSGLFLPTSGATASLLFFLFCKRKRKTFVNHLSVALMLCFVAWTVSCGGSGSKQVSPPKSIPPAAGTYEFTVTATSSGHSAPAINLSLTVQ